LYSGGWSKVTSADGTMITPAGGGALFNADGIWTWGGQAGNDTVTLLNNSSANGGSALMMEVWNGGQLYAYDSGAQWWLYSSGSWSNVTSGSHP
jgi:hypothetical protein